MTAKEKSLHEIYKIFLDTATSNSLPVNTLKTVAIEDVMGFGTTLDEKIFSLDGFLKLLELQREQSEGLDMQWDFLPIFRRIASDTNSAVFADDALLNLTVNNEIVTMKIRVTTVFEFIDSNWKIVHWHTSKPENTQDETDTFGIDIWKQKNAELEKLVEERTAELSKKNKELEVESSLERVRSQAMAMQNSNDLIKSTTILFEELEKLKLNIKRSGIGIFNAKRKDCSLWTTVVNDKGKKEVSTGSTSLTVHPMLIETFKSWEKQKTLSYILEGNELVDYYKIAKKSKSHLSKETIKKSYSLPKEYYLFTPFEAGGIYLFSDTAPTVSDKQIIKRFAEVFHLTYTRYEDLQKAEAQNREAEIELALERVRARTMAMQHSDELGEVSFLLDAQVRGLGLKTWGCAFNIYGENDSTEWFSSQNGTLPVYKTPREKLFLRYYEAGQKGETLLIKEFAGKACVAHYEYLSTIPIMGDALKQMIANGGSFPTQQIDHITYFKYGYLLFITFEPAPEAHDIFKRFAKVFEQTYTRFLDLQKAEAQTRESQINLAVERVRARSLAMFKSEEILDVVFKMKEEVINLNIPNVLASTIHLKEKNGNCRMWDITSIEAEENQVHQPFDISFRLEDTLPDLFVRRIWNNTEKYFLESQNEKDLAITFKWIRTHGKDKEADESSQFLKEAGIKIIYHPTIQLANGRMSLDVLDLPTTEIETILTKMGAAFDLAYKRFEDLKNSEAQLKEAQIETALEKVRSRTMAMQKSEELSETATEVFRQIQFLGIHPWSFGFNIFDTDNQIITQWVSSADGRAFPPFDSSANEDVFLRFTKSYKKGVSFYSEEIGGKELVAHYEYMSNLPVIGKGIKELKESGVELPTFQIFNLAFFKQGYLLFITYENVPEAHEIFVRFAKVFEQTYTRFLDLQKAEAQTLRAEQDLFEIKIARKKAEEALTELKSTQTQLIQSEKMASLGELTAGIAHEIQNPLNFVNNFSEVSAELLAEMQEEINSGNLEDAKEILTDVLQNLEKINHHGKRADAIVKGMLQHSRSSSGKKELTDLNALCDEYLRLSYHGLRAKDKNFNATMKTDFDENIGKINIIPQDIGRVVLNLLTNAFYVVNEKQHSDVENYEPTVFITTKKENNKITISISDNGNGMPKEIIDKIFQPFFTTKPTGKGTGLGLSLAYDIVTKGHNGELKVESIENKGTTFCIVLKV